MAIDWGRSRIEQKLVANRKFARRGMNSPFRCPACGAVTCHRQRARRVRQSAAGAAASEDIPDEVGVSGLAEDDHLVARSQRCVGVRGDQVAVADDEADPGVLRQGNRRQPIRMPPSNKITARATVTTCSTVANDKLPKRGQMSEAAAAPIRKNAGAGMRTRSLTRLDSTAAVPTSAATRTARPKDSTSAIKCLAYVRARPYTWRHPQPGPVRPGRRTPARPC